MSINHPNMIGGAPVGVLNRMEPWKSDVILNLRLWCEGADGRAQVWKDFVTHWPLSKAQLEMQNFEQLIMVLTRHATRPLVRHDVACSCAGADECIFAHLIETASLGHLNDAALIASLLVGPSHAELVALLAGKVGEAAKRIAAQEAATTTPVNEPSKSYQLH